MATFNGQIAVQFLGHTASGQTTSNSFHIANAAAGSPPDLTELQNVGAQLLTQFSATYRALGVTTWTWDSIITKQVVDPLNPVVYLEAVTNVALAGTRTIAGHAVPEALCGVVSLKTPNASRRFRGHMFAPPAFNDATLSGNLLDSGNAYWTNLGLFAAELFKGTPLGSGWTGAQLSHYELVIYSKTAALAAQPSVANVSGVTVKTKASFLRSRERGGT